MSNADDILRFLSVVDVGGLDQIMNGKGNNVNPFWRNLIIILQQRAVSKLGGKVKNRTEIKANQTFSLKDKKYICTDSYT
jgi:hypothetical protein